MTTCNSLNNRSCFIINSQSVAWFCGANQANNVTGNGASYTLLYAADLIGRGSPVNLATGTLTFPTTGLYYLGALAQVSGINGSGTFAMLTININGTDFIISESSAQNTVSGDKYAMSGSLFYYATASQTAYVYVRTYGQGAGTVTLEGGTSISNFWGALVR